MMDPSKRERIITSVLECSVCLETYTKPKVLPCGHTFCLSCLLSLPRDADRITCPQCRKQHNIPGDGMQQFADNFMAITMLDMSSHEPTSVCEACGDNKNNEFCDHCLKDVCAECWAHHKSSMVKIETHIDILHKMFHSPSTVNKIYKNSAKWQTSLDNIARERARIEKYFTKCIELLESRRKVHNDYFDTLDNLHNIFLGCTDLQASELLGDKLREDLLRSCTTCTNTRKLDDIKSSVSELQQLSQMMLTMETGERFIFKCDMTTITQLLSLSDVTLGGVPLEIRLGPCLDAMNEATTLQACAESSCDTTSPINEDHPAGVAAPACAVVTETSCLEVNYFVKGINVTILPTDDSRICKPTGAAYCSCTNTILVADKNNRRIMRYDMDGSNGRNFVRHGVTECGEFKPWDVATSQSGRVFVTDNQNQRVLVFTRDGDYVTSFGSRGTGDDQFRYMVGIACHNGCVLVCDSRNSRVTMVTEDGGLIRHIVPRLCKPQFVAVGPGDTIYVTVCDTTGARYRSNVRVHCWDGTPVRQFGAFMGADRAIPSGIQSTLDITNFRGAHKTVRYIKGSLYRRYGGTREY